MVNLLKAISKALENNTRCFLELGFFVRYSQNGTNFRPHNISYFINLQRRSVKYFVLSESQGYPVLLRCTSEKETMPLH